MSDVKEIIYRSPSEGNYRLLKYIVTIIPLVVIGGSIFVIALSIKNTKTIPTEAASTVLGRSVQAPRGIPEDLWADTVLGQPDFTQVTPREIVPFKVAGPGGTLVDRNVTPNRVYIYDGINSRILGYTSLGVCRSNSTSACSSDSDCAGSSCQLQVGGQTGDKKPDIVIGQASGWDYSACNRDSSLETYPKLAPARNDSLCFMQDTQISLFEGGSFASMALDNEGSLYVPDFYNNRVLKFFKPFETDQIADDVWGQIDFSQRMCNQGLARPSSTTLCLAEIGNTAGVDIDNKGNMWVADSGNHRVLRFPLTSGKISQSANLVLGQSSFTENTLGTALNKLNGPSAIRVDPSDRVYVADAQNNRVVIYDGALTSGMNGRLFASNFNFPNGIEFDVPLSTDPTSGGIWISDTNNNQLVLFDSSGVVKKTLFKDVYRPDGQCGNPNMYCDSPLGHDTCNLCDARGSIGITRDGDVIVAASSFAQNVNFYQHPIPTPVAEKPYPAIAEFFSPPGNHNYLSNRGFDSPRDVVTTDSQIIISDAGRIMYWNTPNGITDLINGKVADGVAGVADFSKFSKPDFGRMDTDTKGNLWILKDRIIQRYTLPLTNGQLPAQEILSSKFVLLGQANSLNKQIVLTDIHADREGKYLWIAMPNNDRVVRVLVPSNYAGPYTIDVIIGGSSIPDETIGWQLPCDQHPDYPNTLCYPGTVTEDRNHHVYISDYYLEQAGSGRFFRFDRSKFSIDTASLLTYNTTAAAQQFTGVEGWKPAFDSQNHMVLGFSGYSGKTFPQMYTDILSKKSSTLIPDDTLKDFYSQAFSPVFDKNDNLFLTDLNRGRVLLYKQPFPSSTPTPTPGPITIKNGSFEQDSDNNKIPDYWVKNKDTEAKDVKTAQFAKDGTSSFVFVGNKKKWKYINQKLNGPTPSGKIFYLSGWVKANKAESGNTIRLTAIVTYQDGSVLQYYLPFPGGSYDWMYKSGSLTVDKPTVSVSVRAVAGYQSGTIYVDSVNFTDQPQLTKSGFTQLAPEKVASYE